MDEQIDAKVTIDFLRPRRFGWPGKLWTAILVVVVLIGLVAYFRQLKYGLEVTGMGDYASWGLYISNFVFFVAISLVGSLITAILRLSGAKWSAPITRIAEIIAVSAIVCASIIIVVDMGRPERFWHLFVYGRLQSPIVWDVIVIGTYLVLSLLLLYLPLLSDLSLLKNDDELGPRLRRLYSIISLKWNGNQQQVLCATKAIRMLSITIIPVALAIHTVTAWLFATTYRPGWDSTNFGAYFVSGAFLVGAGGVVIAMFVFRKNYNLQAFITDKHFDHMGKLLVLLALLYLYFNVNEYLVPAFKMKTAEADHLSGLLSGDFALLFWVVIIFGMVVPVFVLLTKKGRKPLPMFIMAILVVVGAWFKRYLIVAPTLLHPFLPMQEVPDKFLHYSPTWEEWAITLGSLAGAMLLITLFVRIFPIIPIQETIQAQNSDSGTKRDSIKDLDLQVSSKLKGLTTILLVLFLSISINTFGQDTEKQKARISLEYYQTLGERPFLTTRVRSRVGRRLEPVNGVILNLFLNEESKMGMMGNISTNQDGRATFLLPDKFAAAFDTLPHLEFIARLLDDPKFDDQRKTIAVTKAQFSLETVETAGSNQLTFGITMFDNESNVVPAEDVEVIFSIQRMFSMWPLTEDPVLTDEKGIATIDFPLDLPGDENGNLEIAAQVVDHDFFGNLEVREIANWGIPLREDTSFDKRTLWASRDKTPVWLLVIPNLMILAVWVVILFILVQLGKIYTFGKSK